MKKVFLAIVISFSSLLIHAQINGKLLDSTTGNAVERAIVGLVIKSAISDTNYYFTNERGIFEILPVPASSFYLIVSAHSYKTVTKFFEINKPTKSIDAGTIFLTDQAKLLSTIVVETPPIVIKEDTIEYRADAFKVKENAMTEDLLKKLPGIQVDKDGNVTAQGKTVTKVRVNGKDFFGGDVKTATRELPANIIDKVQVIDDYGEQASVSGIKDGDPEKIINLQIKKDKNKGVFGRVTAGAGTEDRYQASVNANYFNNQQQISLFANSNNTSQSLFNFGNMGVANRGMGNMMKNGQRMMNDMGGGTGVMNAFQNGDQSLVTGNQSSNNGITTSNSIGINYRDQWTKKINVYGSYSFAHRNNNSEQTTSTQNFFENSSFVNNQNENTGSIGDNHRFYLNMEYQIDSFNYLKLSPTVTYASSNTNSKTLFDYFSGTGTKTSDGSNSNGTTATSPNVSGNLLYNHRFKKRGRNFSANINIGTSNNNSDQNSQNNSNYYVSPVGVFNQNQLISQVNSNHNYGIRLTYSEPLSKTRNLDIAASHNLNYAGNDKKVYSVDPSTGNQTFVPYLSNNFENNFYNNRIGMSIRTTQKKYNYTIGFSLQPVSLQGNSVTKDSAYKTINRVNVFPIARFSYNFSKAKTFTANYSGNATQPTFSQLQDVLDISNQQFVSKGNPLLKPSINHNVNIGYNNFNIVSGKVIFANLNFSVINNQIVNNSISRGNTGAQLSIPENVNGFYNVMGFYTFSKPFQKRKYVLTVNGTLNYNHNVNLVDSIRNIGRNWIGRQGFTFEYNYKTWLQLGMGASYSINDISYSKPAGSTLSILQNTNSSALTLSSNIDMDVKGGWIIKYDFDYTFNYGLNASVTRNLAILTTSVEKQLFKKKNGIIKFAAFDLFNQNTNISRTVSSNAIIDSRSNRLARFFMLTFTYRLQKFKGEKPKGPSFKTMNVENKNAEIKVF